MATSVMFYNRDYKTNAKEFPGALLQTPPGASFLDPGLWSQYLIKSEDTPLASILALGA